MCALFWTKHFTSSIWDELHLWYEKFHFFNQAVLFWNFMLFLREYLFQNTWAIIVKQCTIISGDQFKWRLIANITGTYLSNKAKGKQLKRGENPLFNVLHLVGYSTIIGCFRFLIASPVFLVFYWLLVFKGKNNENVLLDWWRYPQVSF